MSDKAAGAPRTNLKTVLKQIKRASMPGEVTKLLYDESTVDVPEMEQVGISKLADLVVGAKINLKSVNSAASIHYNFSNRISKFRRIVFWQPPQPKMPIRKLAVALSEHPFIKTAGPRHFLAEHSEDAWSIGSIYELINRSPTAVTKFFEIFFDSVIVVLNGSSDVPFLIRSATPRARLLFITDTEPTPLQARNSDSIVEYGRLAGGTTAQPSLDDIAAAVKHIFQIHSRREISSYMAIKKGDVPQIDLQDAHSDHNETIIFVDNDPPNISDCTTFNEILEKLYNSASQVFVPSYLNLVFETILNENPAGQRDILQRLFSEGAGFKTVSSS